MGLSSAIAPPITTGGQMIMCAHMGGPTRRSKANTKGITMAPSMKMTNTAGPSPESCGPRSSPHSTQRSATPSSPSNSLPRPQRGQRHRSPADSGATDGVPGLLGNAAACFVADADQGFDEEALLHLYNVMAERGGHLLLTARVPVPRWGVALPDLSSRLATAMSVAVEAPDDELIAGVLIKHFLDRQIRVDPAVATFLLGRMERSFAAARRVVAALDAAGLAEKRGITIPLAREVMRRLDFESKGREDGWISD